MRDDHISGRRLRLCTALDDELTDEHEVWVEQVVDGQIVRQPLLAVYKTPIDGRVVTILTSRERSNQDVDESLRALDALRASSLQEPQ